MSDICSIFPKNMSKVRYNIFDEPLKLLIRSTIVVSLSAEGTLTTFCVMVVLALFTRPTFT